MGKHQNPMFPLQLYFMKILKACSSQYKQCNSHRTHIRYTIIALLLNCKQEFIDSTVPRWSLRNMVIVLSTLYILITSVAVGIRELNVPHGHSIWHLNIALIDFPNNYLHVLGNTEGGTRDTLRRETESKTTWVHGKCWKKKLSQCLSSKAPEVFFQCESILKH